MEFLEVHSNWFLSDVIITLKKKRTQDGRELLKHGGVSLLFPNVMTFMSVFWAYLMLFFSAVVAKPCIFLQWGRKLR